MLDPAFLKLRLFSASVEQLASGCRWAEGPQWFGDGRYLLFSDIPNNRILRWDECTGATSVFRAPSNNANGLARDRQGRLLACEHLTRRITRTEYDGSITVLADRFEGKRLNSPNDIVCARDGSIWFTDPLFGIAGHWEGAPADSETPWAVYRIDPPSGELQQDDRRPRRAQRPGLHARRTRPVRGGKPRRAAPQDLALRPRRRRPPVEQALVRGCAGPGRLRRHCGRYAGNVWCGFGSNGAPGADAAALDGVRVYDPAGKALGHIHLPERCANLCFGGAKNNRLFMAASHSLYALFVNVQGA